MNGASPQRVPARIINSGREAGSRNQSKTWAVRALPRRKAKYRYAPAAITATSKASKRIFLDIRRIIHAGKFLRKTYASLCIFLHGQFNIGTLTFYIQGEPNHVPLHSTLSLPSRGSSR